MRTLEDQQGWNACLDVGALGVRAGKVPNHDSLLSWSVLEQEETIRCVQTLGPAGDYSRPPMLDYDPPNLNRAHRVLGLNVHCTSLASTVSSSEASAAMLTPRQS